ncbi:PPGB-like protein [Mya arenaria]|uniref:Carboxypeptidase n=1 Tax=Mya arenaria TaxID=6604 RepID=A0ABY7ETV2_MYAAR|nr:PPGB-like protein [Mya arenaria]
MLYLEAPAGVGYSYSEDKNYTTSDDEVASDNYLALKSFFVKFPEYKSNPFYITGESYGGIYVPTLSAIVLHDSSMNFQGMAIGNGISNFDTNDDSLLYFGYYHGLIGEDLWNKMLNACCPGQSVRQCHFQTGYTYNSDCSDLVGQGLDVITSSGLNEYNLYAPCDVPKPDGYIYNNNSFKIKLHQQYEESVQLTPPCLDYGYAISYMNTAEVRVALHISPFAQDWDKSVLVYNGDIDMACNFLGDEWFVEKLNLPVERQRGPWYVTDSNGNKQVAGFTKQFKQLTLTTIRGAGHMVPQDKPEAALEMFASFVQAKRN